VVKPVDKIGNANKEQLAVARTAVTMLRQGIEKKAEVETLSDDEQQVFKDVKGASARFLNATEVDKLDRKPRSKDPKQEDGWFTLRFRITEDQKDVIMNACKRAKEVAELEGRVWKGVALEWVCADFLAGHGMPAVEGDEDKDFTEGS